MLPIVRSSLPRIRPCGEGKFFRVWVSGDSCLKWPRTNMVSEPYGGIPDIATISLVLESAMLTAPIISVLYDSRMETAGICVKRVKIVEKAEIGSTAFLHFERELKTLAETWQLRRRPYKEFPGVSSFVLEARGRKNVGVVNGKLVLVDIDPKCWSDDPQANSIRLFIEQALHCLE